MAAECCSSPSRQRGIRKRGSITIIISVTTSSTTTTTTNNNNNTHTTNNEYQHVTFKSLLSHLTQVISVRNEHYVQVTES